MSQKYDITALGEALIDFTEAGKSANGQRLFEQNAGGAPANMLASAQKCGMHTAFLGKVGADMHGIFLKETMQAAGIDTCGLCMAEDAFTTLAFVALQPSGERVFSFARKKSADVQVTADELDLSILQNTRVLHVGSLSLTDAPCRNATHFAIEQAKKSGAIITYDPNYRANLWASKAQAMEQMRSLLPCVDMMKLSDEECELLTDTADPYAAAQVLHRAGVKIVAVTLGEQGALVSAQGQATAVAGYKPTQVTDTTGAGDSFFGAFVSKILQCNLPLEQISHEQAVGCAQYANAVASLCVEKRGGIPSMPDSTEVAMRMAQ